MIRNVDDRLPGLRLASTSEINSVVVIRRDDAISFNASQNSSSRLTLVLLPRNTTDRLRMADFIIKLATIENAACPQWYSTLAFSSIRAGESKTRLSFNTRDNLRLSRHNYQRAPTVCWHHQYTFLPACRALSRMNDMRAFSTVPPALLIGRSFRSDDRSAPVPSRNIRKTWPLIPRDRRSESSRGYI